MEIKIKKLNDITVIFIVGDEDKVEVKYFKKEDEITSWDDLQENEKRTIDILCDVFFKENPELIKWSY